MRISWNWLRTLVDTDLSPQAAAEVLTSTGLEVERVEELQPVKGMLRGVVVGHVLERAKHPDADRLSVCLVDLGQGDPVTIVCGAPNVAAGQKVLVATVGTTLHMADGGELTIKKAKIRGVESQGMICAEDELGLGGGHEGIMVLPDDATPGTPAAEHLGLHSDHILEIGLTPNRTDALGHLGVARDLMAAVVHRTGHATTLRMPSVDAFQVDEERPGAIAVEVSAVHACPRYTGITLGDVRVGPSPAWLQERLRAIGLKPINNVVDVTNYVQHELGQPLHAFDADRIAGGRVRVTHLPEGTPFTTLDGRERKLSTEDLMIADMNGGLCIAGVLGGLDSGVSEGTTRVFLESACFEAVSIRRTARRHAIHTDASFRFERGADPEITLYALKRAALLLREAAGARIQSAPVDIHPHPRPWKEITFPFQAVERLCGVKLDRTEIVRILELLDHRVTHITDRGAQVAVPPYRVDVHREADLVEEIMRIHGFDRIPLPAHLQSPAVYPPAVTPEGFQWRLAQHLAGRGYLEAMTPSLINGGRAIATGAMGEEHAVRLRNPLSTELDVLRPTLLFGLLHAAAHNQARQQHDLRLFERGRIYHRQGDATMEHDRTALLLTGMHTRSSWRAASRPVDLFDVKADIDTLLERIAGRGTPAARTTEHPLLHHAVAWHDRHGTWATAGMVRPEVAAACGATGPVVYAELDDATWMRAIAAQHISYEELPRHFWVRRDLSLLLDQAVPFERLRQLAFQAERKLLREVDLFDVYEGDRLPPGTKSYAISFILQDPMGTLTDTQVEKAMERIKGLLEKEADARLRT